MPDSEEYASDYLERTGVQLEFYGSDLDFENNLDDDDYEYSKALALSNPQEIQRVALSLIEERASA